MTEGTLLEWLVHPGDAVHRGDIIAVVDTDKAAIEVECFTDGIVDELLVSPGTKVPVGTALARIKDGAAEPIGPTEPTAPAEPTPSPNAPTAPDVESPIVRHLAHQAGLDLASVRGSGPAGVITRADVTAAAAPGRASPYARRIASELGVDLSRIQGTGRGGAITSADVEAASGPDRIPRQEIVSRHSSTQALDRAAAMRRTIGDLMARSKREVPHYYLSTTVDMTAATRWLRETNEARSVGTRLVPAALLLKACAVAARKVPNINGWWVDDAYRASEHVHLGVAVSLRPSGLVAPALLDADTLDLDTFMAKLQDLVTRARAGRLRSREMSDGTITVTNLGDNGADAVFGVIYPPQVALVGIGRVREVPVARDGLIGARPTVVITLSADHRVTDGHEGSRYLAAVDALLQTPETL